MHGGQSGATGILDPAFDAHALPFKYWATAHWEGWAPSAGLSSALHDAIRRVLPDPHSAPRWAKVSGPAAALVASAAGSRVTLTADLSFPSLPLRAPSGFVSNLQRFIGCAAADKINMQPGQNFDFKTSASGSR